ncbi:MAG TPA: cadherin-like domain-containing protein [Kiritimatiellia bacterium]|nr:cadherin-like domain-containing protein [Kiritimatiellia bacterium]HPS07850.1 cadherin-like domain-containing protein [Kiritimatiellia bacterium]
MRSLNRKFLKAFVVTAVLLLFACTSRAQVATHSCAGYLSPGTNTIVSQFVYPETSFLGALAWFPVMPDGWLIGKASGDGGPLVSPDKKSILFTAFDLPTPLNFTYTIVVPANFTTDVLFRAQAEYYLDFQPLASYVWATPDPLVLDNLNKTLQIVSPYGTGTPAVGVYTNLVGTVLSLSMTPTGSSGPTQYVCTGWSMTGQEPASGTGNSFQMTVTDNAVLTWNWSQSNIAPSITNDVWIVGYRTPQFKPLANKVTEETLIAQARDPDAGDTLTLTSVNTNGLKGVLVGSGGILTYTPPKQTDSIIDVFTYTVTDSKGASAVGTVKVRVTYGGTMIRAF